MLCVAFFCRYYQFAAISYQSLLYSVIQNSLPGLGMSACQFLGSFFSDSVHPRPKGQLLITDILINYMADAEEVFMKEVGWFRVLGA